MNFFDTIRTGLFHGHMNQPQVDGINAILEALDAAGVTDLKQRAYILATPMIETGGSYVPGVESLNYATAALTAKFGHRITLAQALKYGRTPSHSADQVNIGNTIYGGTWGRANLGNTEPGDGFLYRGRGLVQITGRRLYALMGPLVGQDLLSHPELACDLQDAAKIMVTGMHDGLLTGVKLSQYLGPTLDHWVDARKVVNGSDRAQDIVRAANQFYAALTHAA